MISNSLYIPIEVKAMVVNDKVRISKNFQRWKMNFDSVKEFTKPDPKPDTFSNTSDLRNDPKANGVYLHWTLPAAMRMGTQMNANANARTNFPLVPNRWLVVRYSGPLNARVATAWVVESDFVDPNEGTVPYLDPYVEYVKVTSIGRKYKLHEWKENATKSPFLTAVGPGDITFASYQPYVENVFSIHDPLTDIAKQDTLSYLVVGWYSNSKKDILANWEAENNFADLLVSLQWQVMDEKKTAHTSVCHGLVYGIVWDNRKECKAPASFMPDLKNVAVAVGNTSIDALTALIHRKQGEGGDIDVQLLEAFQYGLLNKLNEPNGAELLYQAIHKAWFGSYEGGYEWIIVKKPDTASGSLYPDQEIDWNDSKLNPAWLADLNKDQQSCDSAAQELRTLRWELYSMWLTQGRFNHLKPDQRDILKENDSNFTVENFAAQLNPEKSRSLANKVKNKMKDLADLQAKIPHGATQEDLQNSIAQFAANKNLPNGYELKQVARENFYEANNPVVLLAGMNTPLMLAQHKALSCRFADSLIRGFKFNDKEITAQSMRDTIPLPEGVNKIPVAVRGLIEEFFFLDPNNATLVTEKTLNETDPNSIEQVIANVDQVMAKHETDIGQLPDMVLGTWEQPWLPLYLMWQVEYYPIGVENWTFDGIQYGWNGKGASTNPIILQGTTFMTPQSGFNFRKRLEDYLQKHPAVGSDADAALNRSLDSLIKQTDTWDLLSQTLEGFMDQLALRDVQSHVMPSDKILADLIDEGNSIAPDLGALPQSSKGGWLKSNFQAYRSGLFAFRRLNVVDRFGQSLEVVNTKSYKYFEPVIAPEMIPKIPQETTQMKNMFQQMSYRFIELRPRLLQPAKLAFNFVSNTDDSKSINLYSNANPVCAWVLPNYLDKALSCYDPFGNFLGELCVFTTAGNQKEVKWFPAPNTDNDLDSIAKCFPYLGGMLNSLAKNENGPQAFHDFLQTIDETLYVIDPLGTRDDQNLSVLIGRPLALVRSRLQFQLDGPALTDPSWEYVFQSKTSEPAKYAFPIRLGELALRNDGLIGYYNGDDYSQFNTVHMPKEGSITPYIKEIAKGNFINLKFEDSSAAYISMLLDPRVAVHATTSILPTLALELPTRYIDPALVNMAVTFRVGPLLSDINIAKADSEVGATNDEISLVMPIPAKQNGKWSWLPVNGAPMPLEDADANVHFSNIPSELRTGYLQLVNALKTNLAVNSQNKS